MLVHRILWAFVVLLLLGSSWSQEETPSEDEKNDSEEEEEQPCEDTHPSCWEWAEMGECQKNPYFMRSGCRASCLLCVNATKWREEGVDEDTIKFREMIANLETEQQHWMTADEEEAEKIQALLADMEIYLRTSKDTLDWESDVIKKHCRNKSDQCILDQYQSNMCEVTLTFAMNNCALACRYCHELPEFLASRGKREWNAQPVITSGDLYEKMQSMKEKEGARLDEREASQGRKDLRQDMPWVLIVDNFLTDKECDHLIKMSHKIGYKAPPEKNKERVRTKFQKALCQDGSCDEDKDYKALVERIANFAEVPLGYLESAEFFKFFKGDAYGAHHDFHMHDAWKPAGHVVWTVFVCLSDVKEGGQMGFPELNWLNVPPAKGQLLIWPSVRSSDPKKIHKDMISEGLPVLDGEKYGMQIKIRMFELAHEKKPGLDAPKEEL